MQHPVRFILSVTTALVLTACSSSRPSPSLLGETTMSSTHRKGIPGGVLVETTTLNATVTAIDAANRELTVTAPDGKQETIGCGPEVINFGQIRVGDHVRVTVTSRLDLSMAKANALPVDAAITEGAPASEGAKPAAIRSETQEYTAVVADINHRRHQATLRLPDDSTRTFTVRSDVDLTQRKVGEKMSVRVAVTVAISVEKP